VKDIAESRYKIPVTINALTRAFDCPRSRVQTALAHWLDDPGQRGKPAAIDQDHEQDTPVTKTDIMDHCTAIFKITFT
jgi:hypothetical protein